MVVDADAGFWVARGRAGWSLRLRLHSGLRQQGARFARAGFLYGLKPVPFKGCGEKGLRVWVGLRDSGSFGCAQDDRWFGWAEMGGGGRARRAIPTHRKVRDGWGTRRVRLRLQSSQGQADVWLHLFPL